MPGVDLGWFSDYARRIMGRHKLRTSVLDQGLDLYIDMLIENTIPTFSCVMLEREILQNCNWDSPVPRYLDWWLWQQVAQQN
jgi:hypothetical protein